MSRVVLFSVVLSSVLSTLVTTLVLGAILPTAIAAQQTSLRADQSVVVGPSGVDRERMTLGQGINTSISVLNPDGQVRALMGAGGPTGLEPETADFVVFAQDGKSIARLGTRQHSR